MKLEFVNNSIVALAQAYSPQFLQPEALKLKKIVPSDWDPEDVPITSPVLSLVKYKNGFSFLLQPNKLEIIEGNPPEDMTFAQTPDIARKLIRDMASQSTAIGINLVGFIEVPNADELIAQRFLQPELWTQRKLAPSSVSLTFTYALKDATLRLVIDKGFVKFARESVQNEGLLLSANYEVPINPDLPLDANLDAAIYAIRQFKRRVKHFSETINALFEVGVT